MHEEVTPFPGGVDALTGELVYAPDLDPAVKPPRTKRGLIDGVDPKDLAQTGWGLLFASSDERFEEILEALGPLSARRKAQAGMRYHEYVGRDGYRAGQDKLAFLTEKGVAPGRVDPSLVPYYLLLVGSPEQIPYRFQYELDQQHAVGRICFSTPEEYASYAAAVVAAEEEAERPPRKRVAFFGPLQDENTRLSKDALLTPLIEDVRSRQDCTVEELLGQNATKGALGRLLEGNERPDLLFTAGHGIFYQSGHPLQTTHQGALVCQDWSGGGHPPETRHLFSGEDVNGARLQGLLAFLFACNSAGTPDVGDFTAKENGGAPQAAPRPFVSGLAQRLLAGGALAVVGHVERVWRCSFLWRQTGSQPQPFVETLRRLLDGGPLGWAMEPLGDRFSDLSDCLRSLLADKYLGLPVDESLFQELWTACHDARNYVIVGDPAVRLFTPASPPPPVRITRSGLDAKR